MKGKQGIAMVVVAAVLVGIAVWQQRRTAPPSSSPIGRKILPELNVNAITGIRIEDAAGSLTVKREAGSWILGEKHGYPAKFETVRNSLMALAEAKVRDAITFTAAHREALGMASAPATNGTPTRVTLEAGDAPVATLWLGRTAMPAASETPSPMMMPGMPEGRYVSTDKGNTVQLTAATFDKFVSNPNDWMDSDLLNVEAAELTHIRIGAAGSPEAVDLAKDETGTWLLAGLGEQEQTVRFRMTRLQSALAALKLIDIADPALDAAAMGLDKAPVFTAETADGRTFTVQAGNETGAAGGRYVRIAVEYTPPPPAPAATTTNGAAEVAAVPTPTGNASLAAQVAEQQKDFSQWTYVLSGPKAEVFRTLRSELVEAKPKPEVPAAESPAEINTVPQATAVPEPTPEEPQAAPVAAPEAAAGADTTTMPESPAPDGMAAPLNTEN